MAKKKVEETKILEAIATLKEAGLLNPNIELPQRGYSLKDAATALGVTYRTAIGYVEQGKLKANKVGGKWNIEKADLEAFMRQG